MDWSYLASEAARAYGTPCYVCAWAPVEDALRELDLLRGPIPIRHWLSFKTHPVAPLVREWSRRGWPVEVVSEFELRGALAEGVPAERILVNGVAKGMWLADIAVPRLRVHVDSLEEMPELIALAKRLHWSLGLRLLVSEQFDPDEPDFSGQFGLTVREAGAVLSGAREAGLEPDSVGFHLRVNVRTPDSYRRALEESGEICRSIKFEPQYVDCGGGLPVPGERPTDMDFEPSPFNLSGLQEVLLNEVPKQFPTVKQLWLANGRFVTARSAVLVVRVLDIKVRNECRYLICDGGRVNNAIVSDWEMHKVTVFPSRTGKLTLTTICGPTCMAFDRLARVKLPVDIEIGDLVLWHNAGAYHIPWETRFSHGLAAIVWVDPTGSISLARAHEPFEEWWTRSV